MKEVEDKKINDISIDNNFEKIREISNRAFADAQNILIGEKINLEYDINDRINEIKSLLNTVENYNKGQAENLVSEAILDLYFIANPETEVCSFRLAHVIKGMEQQREQVKLKDGGKIMDKGEKFLPIGTVAMLEGGTKRVMITGFCAVEEKNREKIWDYSGCLYPEGVLSSKQTCLFNHSQIKQVYHLGLANDDEEKAFKTKLNELIKAVNTASSTTENANTVQ